MKRTKLSDRLLPDYTKGEEIFNMTSHIVGGGLGVLALVLCVVFSALRRDPWAITGSCIYGVSLIALYTGFRLWGFGGMILAPILTVTARELCRSD